MYKIYCRLDTIEITADHKLPQRDYLTPLKIKVTDSGEHYRYKVDLSKTSIVPDCISNFGKALYFALADAGTEDVRITRYDFAFDVYDVKYKLLYKSHKFILLCLDNYKSPPKDTENHKDVDSRGAWSPKKKIVQVRHPKYQIASYDKSEQDGGASGIEGRFEFRRTGLIDDYDEELHPDNALFMVEMILREFIVDIQRATAKENIDRVVARLNTNCIDYYDEAVADDELPEGFGHLVGACRDYIFTRPQLKELIRQRGDNKDDSLEQSTDHYKNQYKIQCCTAKDIKDLSYNLVAAAKLFLENSAEDAEIA